MDFLHNIAYIEKILMHVINLFFAKNFLGPGLSMHKYKNYFRKALIETSNGSKMFRTDSN